jgi:glyoxylase-like metal-dependent hydrolase (beta-lactamase superfamily II)
VEIVPGLHQIKTPMNTPGLDFVMPYVFEEADGVTLFDAGYGTNEATAAMTAELAERGYQPSDIKRLIISHAHPDHLGMAGWVKEQSPDSELVMLEREWEWIRQRWMDFQHWEDASNTWLVRHGVSAAEVEAADRAGAIGLGGALSSPSGFRKFVGQTLGRIKNGNPDRNWRRNFRMDVNPDRVLQDGETIEFGDWVLQAVWTPGHTPGHLCVYEPNHRLMLTGDHVLPRITPNVSMHIDDEETERSPLAEYLSSLKKTAEFETDCGLPAHEWNIEDLPARCRALIAHHDERLAEVLHGIGDGAATASEVSGRVHWNTRPFEEFSIWQKRSALGETLAHLEVLRADGRVRRFDDEHTRWERV